MIGPPHPSPPPPPFVYSSTALALCHDVGRDIEDEKTG